MFPRLSLRLHWGHKASWTETSTSKDARTGAVIERSGTRLEQGWRLTFVNGLVLAGPFQRVYAMGLNREVLLSWPASSAVRNRFLRQNAQARNSSWGPFKRGLMALLALPCNLFALTASLVTLPLFAALWVLWAVVAGFWLLALVISRWALTNILRRPS